MIHHTCPDCQHLLSSLEVLAGLAVACPHCRSGVRVPRRTGVMLKEPFPVPAGADPGTIPAKEPAGSRPRWLTHRMATVMAFPFLVGLFFLMYVGYYYIVVPSIR